MTKFEQIKKENIPIKDLSLAIFICERCNEEKNVREVKLTKDHKIICHYHFFPSKVHDQP